MPRARPLLLVTSCLLAASTSIAQQSPTGTARPVDAGRYALQARIEQHVGRFTLLEADTAKTTPGAARFSLLATADKGATLCAVGGSVFADGFED
jgi:hypothetical protein